MTPFTQTQRVKALFWLSLFHLLVITSSNYLVQLPISIFGFHTTWGAFSFPFIFLATDLTVRIFGAPLARRIIFAVIRRTAALKSVCRPYRRRQLYGLRAGTNSGCACL